jgi:hypothetical protein
MKRVNFLLMVTGLVIGSAATPGVLAQSLIATRATIPFEFVARGKTLPAGKYQFEHTRYQHVISLQDSEGHAHLLPGIPLGGPGRDGNPRLIFTRQGGQYFLSQAWIRGDGTGQQFAKPAEAPGSVQISLNLR